MRFPFKAVLVTAFLMTLPTGVAAQASVGFRGGLSLASVGGDVARRSGQSSARAPHGRGAFYLGQGQESGQGAVGSLIWCAGSGMRPGTRTAIP